MVNVVSYCRVPLIGANSLQDQLESIDEFCKKNNYNHVCSFSDDGYEDDIVRPGTVALLDYCENNEGIDYVVVDKLDCLTRDAMAQLFFEHKLMKHNIKVLFASQESLNDSNPINELLRTMCMAFAKYEARSAAIA